MRVYHIFKHGRPSLETKNSSPNVYPSSSVRHVREGSVIKSGTLLCTTYDALKSGSTGLLTRGQTDPELNSGDINCKWGVFVNP